MSGRKAVSVERPTIDQGRSYLLQCAARIEPRVLSSLHPRHGNRERNRSSRPSILTIYRQIFRPDPAELNQGQLKILARQLGWENEIDATMANRKSADRWPEVFWRDPNPDPKLGRLRRRVREARG